MPTYDYECNQCKKTFEVFQSIKAEKLKECPDCGGPVKRIIGTGAALIFKGSGFYETDFKTKKGPKPEENKQKTEEKKTESKPSTSDNLKS
ncbi:MAG: zinc ribbon domain-containing protein [Candidatus Aureabacteria bacterium]|nr:zinc ribbon domain-containing protein [Candidatus Auribacterota bacterium]